MGSTSDSDEKLTKILMLKMRFRFWNPNIDYSKTMHTLTF